MYLDKNNIEEIPTNKLDALFDNLINEVRDGIIEDLISVKISKDYDMEVEYRNAYNPKITIYPLIKFLFMITYEIERREEGYEYGDNEVYLFNGRTIEYLNDSELLNTYNWLLTIKRNNSIILTGRGDRIYELKSSNLNYSEMNYDYYFYLFQGEVYRRELIKPIELYASIN